ncbi:hypothetical protein HMPREF0541_01127 [Lacticaseibacillus rhamnosus ATCC 21052]|nr:hypothetical protein HMPREF0541_01127 [Lacticaseibacillus rhamnosus ATCC 21052]
MHHGFFYVLWTGRFMSAITLIGEKATFIESLTRSLIDLVYCS